MPSLFEIRAHATRLNTGVVDTTTVDVVQVELDEDGRRARPIIMMSGTKISFAISLIVDWTAASPQCSGWLSYRVLEGWLASWGSRTYFRENGVDWDPSVLHSMDASVSTNPVDKQLTTAVHDLGRRLAHKPVPIAVAQVIEAYLLASEFDALVLYLQSITAETVTVMV